MKPEETLVPSPERMNRGDTALLVVDVQEKLIGLVAGHSQIVWNIRRLIDGAKALGVRVVATEQYPKGLGATVPELAGLLSDVGSKQAFSCGGCPEAVQSLVKAGVQKILVVGIETHVCVQQSVLDLLAAGYRVYIAADAVGARGAIDHETALRRMDSAGATLTTTESVLFEWCGTAAAPQFKQISGLVKEAPPE